MVGYLGQCQSFSACARGEGSETSVSSHADILGGCESLHTFAVFFDEVLFPEEGAGATLLPDFGGYDHGEKTTSANFLLLMHNLFSKESQMIVPLAIGLMSRSALRLHSTHA